MEGGPHSDNATCFGEQRLGELRGIRGEGPGATSFAVFPLRFCLPFHTVIPLQVPQTCAHTSPEPDSHGGDQGEGHVLAPGLLLGGGASPGERLQGGGVQVPPPGQGLRPTGREKALVKGGTSCVQERMFMLKCLAV